MLGGALLLIAQSGSAPVFGLEASFRYDLVDARRL